MFVDKKLEGVNAVQTLSRLNRTMIGKEETFILDFKNTASEIQKAFQPFYEVSILDQEINPNILYELKAKIRNYNIYNDQDIKKIIDLYSQSQISYQDEKLLGKLTSLFNTIIKRYDLLDNDTKYQFRDLLKKFYNQHSYITQLVRIFDKSLLEESIFVRYLISFTFLSKDHDDQINLHDKIKMEYYKLVKSEEVSIMLAKNETVELKQINDVSLIAPPVDERSLLTEIIEEFNAKFSYAFSEDDKIIVNTILKHVTKNPNNKQIILANKYDFDTFKDLYHQEFSKRLDQIYQSNKNTFNKLFTDENIFNFIKDQSAKLAYQTWRNYDHENELDLSFLNK